MPAQSERMFFSEARFAKGNLKTGETFSIDSGMGGSFNVAFKGWNDSAANFRITNKGWERDIQIPQSDLHTQLFILVAKS